MNTTEFLDAVGTCITVPTYQPRFTSDNLLALANEEQRTTVVQTLTSLREDYFMYTENYAMEANQVKLDIPARAAGRTIKMCYWITSIEEPTENDNCTLLTQMTIEDGRRVGFSGAGAPYAFYLQSDAIYPCPKSATAGFLQVIYPLKPSSLVPVNKTGFVDSFTYNTITLAGTTVPSNIAIGSRIDITKGLPGNVLLYKDLLITDISGTTLTIDGFTADIPLELTQGDGVSTQYTTGIIQLPEEATDVLVQATACRVIEALNIPEEYERATKQLQKKIVALREIMSPRVEGDAPIIIDRNSLIRQFATWRTFPKVSVP